MMNETLKYQLKELASHYETADFLPADPAQFMHRYSSDVDVEVVGLIASCLALGQRPMILSKINTICDLMNGQPSRWIVDKEYEESFGKADSEAKFYRFFSNAQMCTFFSAIREMLATAKTIGRYLHDYYDCGIEPLEALVNHFRIYDVGTLVPRDLHSGCKRLNMYLRWMVRDHSPVDMGLWKWYDKRRLIIPVDTHVMQQALQLGIVRKAGATLSKAREITDAMRQVWPDDPCLGDFALFGLGVDNQQNVKSSQ